MRNNAKSLNHTNDGHQEGILTKIECGIPSLELLTKHTTIQMIQSSPDAKVIKFVLILRDGHHLHILLLLSRIGIGSGSGSVYSIDRVLVQNALIHHMNVVL